MYIFCNITCTYYNITYPFFITESISVEVASSNAVDVEITKTETIIG